MSTYSIKDLEKLSGIKAHTIRIWEQRYHLIEPGRTNTNIRFYSDDDLVKLMNVSLLNQNGYKISKIADLDNDQIKELVLKINSDLPSLSTQTANLIRAMVEVDELLQYGAIIIGSPTYYGSMCFEVKKLLDESVKFHGKLDGKIGAAFSSSANIGGGNETTILDILNAMLIHGMIIQGDPQGDHYGPVAIGAPDARAAKQCVRLGSRVAQLLKRNLAKQ